MVTPLLMMLHAQGPPWHFTGILELAGHKLNAINLANKMLTCLTSQLLLAVGLVLKDSLLPVIFQLAISEIQVGGAEAGGGILVGCSSICIIDCFLLSVHH